MPVIDSTTSIFDAIILPAVFTVQHFQQFFPADFDLIQRDADIAGQQIAGPGWNQAEWNAGVGQARADDANGAVATFTGARE